MSNRSIARVLSVLSMLFLATPGWADATLSGVVSLNRERGAPVAGVEISAKGANVVTTGNDGVFVLTFPDGRPGEDVTVHVKRAGWDVVNDILLDQRLPESSNARPLEVIICVGAERELRVSEFYRLKGNQGVERSFRSKLAELEGRHAATAQERDRLMRERDQALSQVEEWARQAAKRRAEEIDDIHREQLRLFIDGKTDAVLQLLIAAKDDELPPAAQADYDEHVLSFGENSTLLAIGNETQIRAKYIAYIGKYRKEIDLGEFFDRVHRPDLVRAYRDRRALKLELHIAGLAIFSAGLAYGLSKYCWSNPQDIGPQDACNHDKFVGVLAFLAGSGVGLLVWDIGSGLRNEPAEADEMRHLADDYNAALRARLRATKAASVPFSARLAPYATVGGGGAVLVGTF